MKGLFFISCSINYIWKIPIFLLLCQPQNISCQNICECQKNVFEYNSLLLPIDYIIKITNYHEFTNIYDEVYLLDTLKNQYVRTFTQDGELIHIACYRDTLLNGKFIEYYPSGRIKAYFCNDMGKVNGIQYFFDKKGRLIYSKEYTSGALDGEYNWYYNSGQIQFTSYYDQSDSTHYIYNKGYRRNGKLKYFVNYKNGLYHGDCLIYRVNGRLRVEILYQDGIIISKSRKWVGSKMDE